MTPSLPYSDQVDQVKRRVLAGGQDWGSAQQRRKGGWVGAAGPTTTRLREVAAWLGSAEPAVKTLWWRLNVRYHLHSYTRIAAASDRCLAIVGRRGARLFSCHPP